MNKGQSPIATKALQFDVLRGANIARLPQFKNKHGTVAHKRPDGSDWTPAQWLQAVVGELGELANVRKKFERGDLNLAEFQVIAAKELADVQIYLDILALRILDHTMCTGGDSSATILNIPHPTGIDLGTAVVAKFNEVSERVGSTVRLEADAWWYANDEAKTFPAGKKLDGGIAASTGLHPVDSEGGEA